MAMSRFNTVTICALLLGWSFAVTAQAAIVNHTLYMADDDYTFTIPLATTTYTRTVWVEGFTNISGAKPNIGGVILNANEGDTINITVINQTQESHDFEVKGSGVAKVTIAAGASAFVQFVGLPAGNYIYYDPSIDIQTKQEQRAVGMVGALIVRPAGQSAGAPGNLWAGGPAYKKDYVWVVSDMDKLWNAADKAATVRTTPPHYKATYAFINGLFGSKSLKDHTNSPQLGKKDSASNPGIGDAIVIRILNPGMIAHPIHFHGYHGELRTINNVQQTRMVEKDVIDVPPMTTMDLLFHINQPGMYIIHDHTGMMVTQDGIYAEGMLAEFDACTKMTASELLPFTSNTVPFSSACDKYCPKPNIGVPNCGGGGGFGF